MPLTRELAIVVGKETTGGSLLLRCDARRSNTDYLFD